MRLKKYNNFLIKESFSTSNEYYDFVRNNNIEKKFFFDSLLEVTDIPGIKTNFYTSVIDSKGKLLNDIVEPSETYRMHYTIMIEYWFLIPDKHNFGKFSNQLDHLNTIKNSIEEMVDRVGDRVKLDKNEVTSTGKLTFVIGFTSDIIDNSELYRYYNNWESYTGPEYIKGILRLEEMYNNADRYVPGCPSINLYDYIDNDDNDNLIMIGFFTGDELYVIASFNKETKRFTIVREEVISSLRSFINLD